MNACLTKNSKTVQICTSGNVVIVKMGDSTGLPDRYTQASPAAAKAEAERRAAAYVADGYTRTDVA